MSTKSELSSKMLRLDRDEDWECEVPCSPEPPRPTYPFAPGVIDGPAREPMTKLGVVKVVALLLGSCAIAGFGFGYLIERFA